MSVTNLPHDTTLPQPPPADGGRTTCGRGVTWPTASGLMLGWCLWLLVSWIWATWMSYGSVLLWQRAVSLTAASRFMLAAALVGMMTAWPVLRLSQTLPSAHRPGPRVTGLVWMLRDWVGLNLVLAAVVLSLAMGTGWRLPQIMVLLALAGGWSMLAGLLIAWGAAAHHEMARTLLAVGCMLLLAGHNFLPVRQIWAISGPASAWDANTGAAMVGPLWMVAAGIAALSAAAMRVIRPRGRNSRWCGGL